MSSLQHSLQKAAFGLEDDGLVAQRAADRAHILRGPPVIEVTGLHKSFRIPEPRGTQRLARTRYRELRALRGVDFSVHRGEFFGIVGRNGSGKSTLLKVLASIYRADRGRIRIAGRLAPFIELGVGFNPELTAKENVELNGVMMGLGRREARRRLTEVLDFAELRDFVELKLKNYSSGMMVRLAFAVMLGADADIMLVDEVLAVGDAAFAQKCTDVFRAKRAAGKTTVLVTHDMAAVQAFCDRALLIHDGQQRYLGDPEEAALRYYRLNFTGHHETERSAPDASVVDAWLERPDGTRVENLEHGDGFRVNLVIRAERDLPEPGIALELLNVDDVSVLGFGEALEHDDGTARPLRRGQELHVSTEIDRVLVPGRYSILLSLSRSREKADDALRDLRVLEFLVTGSDPQPGMVTVRADVRAELDTEVAAP